MVKVKRTPTSTIATSLSAIVSNKKYLLLFVLGTFGSLSFALCTEGLWWWQEDYILSGTLLVAANEHLIKSTFSLRSLQAREEELREPDDTAMDGGQLDLPAAAVQEFLNKHRLAGMDEMDSSSTTNGGSSIETISLRSAIMPAIGYGTNPRSKKQVVSLYNSTLAYLKFGGRLIDTATRYKNHEILGQAIKDSKLNRKAIWVTSKINPAFLNHDKTEQSTVQTVRKILKQLGFQGDDKYLDMCLIHNQMLGKEQTVAIWKGLIRARNEGLIKVIGVANFNKYEIMELYHETGVLPEVNQIQFHPWSTAGWKEQVAWQKKHRIGTIAYTSLGGCNFHASSSKEGDEWPPILKELASKYHATEAQVLLRWSVQQQVAVIPGSSSPAHIKENLQIPKFTLTREEAHQLEATPAPDTWWKSDVGPNMFSEDHSRKSWHDGWWLN